MYHLRAAESGCSGPGLPCHENVRPREPECRCCRDRGNAPSRTLTTCLPFSSMMSSSPAARIRSRFQPFLSKVLGIAVFPDELFAHTVERSGKDARVARLIEEIGLITGARLGAPKPDTAVAGATSSSNRLRARSRSIGVRVNRSPEPPPGPWRPTMAPSSTLHAAFAFHFPAA